MKPFARRLPLPLPLLLWLLCLLLPLAVPALVRAAEPNLGSVGPLTWKSAGTLPPPITAAQAQSLALKYVGRAAAAGAPPPMFVQVTDKTPYGSVTSTVFYAWLVSVPAVQVAAPTGGGLVWPQDLTVMVNTGTVPGNARLEAVFSAFSKDNWVRPFDPSAAPVDTFQLTSDDGWRLDQSDRVTFNSSVADILAAAWRQTGINPGTAGQWLLRPKKVALSLPAQWVSGELKPLRSPATYWVWHVSGTRTFDVRGPQSAASASDSSASGRYMSGLITLLEDNGASSLAVRGLYLP